MFRCVKCTHNTKKRGKEAQKHTQTAFLGGFYVYIFVLYVGRGEKAAEQGDSGVRNGRIRLTECYFDPTKGPQHTSWSLRPRWRAPHWQGAYLVLAHGVWNFDDF